MAMSRHPERLFALLPGLIAAGWAVMMLFNPGIFNDPDTNWHLATGLLILRTGETPLADPFSWSAAGTPWVAHEWLSEVLMALSYRAADWQGIAALTGAALAIILTHIAVRAGDSLPPQRAAVAVVVVAAGLLPSTLSRPHLLAYVLLVAWIVLLIDARRRDRLPPWWSLLIIILWVNLHASWILGIGLAGVFGLEALVQGPARSQALRQWALFGLACLAATLLNPQGLAAWDYPFAVSTMQTLHLITEWRALDISKDWLNLVYMAGAVACALRLWRHISPIRLLLMAAWLVMAVLHIRHQSVFVLISSLILLEGWRQAGTRSHETTASPVAASMATGLLLAAGLTIRLAVPLQRPDSDAYPAAAIAAVPAAIRASNVINSYDFGGALILLGLRPYVDGRADMYGDTRMRQYERVITGQPAAFEAVVSRGKVGWLLLKPGSALRPLAQRQGWQRLHEDRWAVVLVRPDLAARAGVTAPVS